MKNIFKFSLASMALTVTLAACSPDSHDLQSPGVSPEDLVEGVAFSITHDSQNPNIIHLTSLLPSSYQVAWETPQGRSVGTERTLKIPFDGTYEVKMGVSTRGGYVWSNPAQFTVNDFCAEFVDHFLWTRLSGGVGQSKTWQLDLGMLEDGSAKTTKFKGPHWFWNVNYTWDKLHAKSETETSYANFIDSSPWDAAEAIDPTPAEKDDIGGDTGWYWAADYASNSWMCGLDNYGYMTFDLINGANCTITDAAGNVVAKGTYMLDVDNHTIAFSDCFPVSTSGRTDRDFKLYYLSDDAMMIVSPTSNQSLNYVTKDFFDNYVEEKGPQEPVLPDGWKDDISQTVITSVKWVLSDKNPLDWCNLDGSRMNGWSNLSDYPDWLGTPDPASYADFSMTMDSKDNSVVFAYPDGSEISCGYTLDDKGIYTFDAPIAGTPIVGWASFAVDADNSLRIMSIEKDAMGAVSGMWLGAISAEKPEYTAYHFVPKAGSSSSEGDPAAPWVSALAGKTFKPNTDAFVDWVNFDLTGGWTAPSAFGSDYESNGWVWTADVAKVAESARLSFTKDGNALSAHLTYTKFDGTAVDVSGKVKINADAPSLTFEFPMVDYSGTPAEWVGSTNDQGAFWTTPLAQNEWIWVSHQIVGNNLSNVNEKGFWLGRVSNATANGADKDEILAFWWTLAE